MRAFFISLAGAALAGVIGAHAQTYPSKQITLVVPFPPGGSTDAMARLLQANLQTKLGRIVLVGQVTGDFVSLNPAQLFLRNISILSAKGVSRAQLADALDLVARRRIKPVVEEVCRLDDAAARLELVGGRIRHGETSLFRPVQAA